MTQKLTKQFGLQPLPEDNRDFSLGAIDCLPNLNYIPVHFEISFIVKDQGSTDWCTAYATCTASERQEHTELEPGYTFAASKHITGNVDEWGQDIRSSMKAHVKYGALPTDMTPDAIKHNVSLQDQRKWTTWQNLQSSAYIHRKKSYFKITGQYDSFDNIRAALYKYKRPIVIGIQFGYDINDVYFDTVQQGYGHAMAVTGYTIFNGEPALIVANSYGLDAGDNGKHYITRTVINRWVHMYGAYTFIDIDPKEAKEHLTKGIQLSDHWLNKLWKRILYNVNAVINRLLVNI